MINGKTVFIFGMLLLSFGFMASSSASETGSAEIARGNHYLVSRDNAWTFLQHDYITGYVDYDFVYVNDSYYRVDWRWNNDYVKDVLEKCTTEKGLNQQLCLKEVSVNSLLSRFELEALNEKPQPKNSKPDLDACFEIENSEERLNCVKNSKAKPVSAPQNLIRVNNWPKLINYTDFSEKCKDLEGKNSLECRKNYAEAAFEQLDYEVGDFLNSFFTGKDIVKIRDDVAYLKQNDLPKEVIKGNAEIIGTVNPLNMENGSFYIHLKDGFRNSNGLRLKWGMGTTIVEFNNSKTTESLLFTFLGYRNFTRYLELPKYAVVENATIDLTGFRINLRNYTLTFETETYWDTGINTDFALSDDKSIYLTVHHNGSIMGDRVISKYWKENLSLVWDTITNDTTIDGYAIDNDFIYICQNSPYPLGNIIKINKTDGTIVLTKDKSCRSDATFSTAVLTTNATESFLYAVNASSIVVYNKTDLTVNNLVAVPTGGDQVALDAGICENTDSIFYLGRNFSASFNKSNMQQQLWNHTLMQTLPNNPTNFETYCIARDDFVLFKARDSGSSNTRTWKIWTNGTLGINSTTGNTRLPLRWGCGDGVTNFDEWQHCGGYWDGGSFYNTTTLTNIFSYALGCTGDDLTCTEDVRTDGKSLRLMNIVTSDINDIAFYGVTLAYVTGPPITTINLTKIERTFPQNSSINAGTDTFVEYKNLSNLDGLVSSVSLNASSLNSALNSGACDCTGCLLSGDVCSIPVVFTSNSTGMLEYSNINIVYNTNPSFTVNTTDDSNMTNTTNLNTNVTFNANITDADNDDVKLLVCDSSGRSGTGCLDVEYCSTGLTAQGSKSCQFNTTSLTGIEYNWTSFACDNSSACVTGINGSFYISRPKDPAMYVNGSLIWNYTGLFNGPVTVEGFETKVKNDLNACTTENCNVSLTFYSDSKGKIEIYLINLQYQIYDTQAPVINNITVEPNPVKTNSSMNITVNATDNANLTRVTADHKEGSVNLTYNEATRLWKGAMISPSTVGIYQLNITAIDSSNLTTVNSTSTSGASNTSTSCTGVCISGGDEGESELMIYSSDIVYLPSSLLENENVTINATVYNFGGAAANNFKVELQVDGVHKTYNTISLNGFNSAVTQFSWNASLGNHTIKVAADYTNVITEANETNNNASRTVSVQDATPPLISGISTTRGSLHVKVNITDNQNVSSAVAIVNSTQITLSYNQSSGYYEGTDASTAPGTYPMSIKVTDSAGLTTTVRTSVTVYPDPLDLAIDSEGLWFSKPYPKEGEQTVVYTRIQNRGINNSNNFTVELQVDGNSKVNNTLAVQGNSNATTQFTWTSEYGNHTIIVKADANSSISEQNESNNQISRTINVSDATQPEINELLLPITTYENGNLTIKINATDNVGIRSVNTTINSATLLMQYNAATKFYENTSTSLPAGTYDLEITATDTNSLSSTLHENLRIYPSQAELALGTGDIELSPSNATENEQLNITAIVYNFGGSDANNAKVELKVDGISIQNKTHSFAKGSQNETLLTWTSVYGAHNLTVLADADNTITESNESNNQKVRSFFVADITPPPKPSPTANPSNWTNLTTHTISWNPVSDTNGISKYEYRIDEDNWTSNGLSTSFITPAQTDGVHTVYVRAVDTPGNIGNDANVSLYIDSPLPNAPVLTEWHSGKNWSTHDTPYLSWINPGDEGSGIINFTISINSDAEISLGRNMSYHANSLSTGTHTFKVKSYDALGQSSPWSNTVTTRIDVTQPNAPKINSTTHTNNNTQYANKMPFFNITAQSDDSGIQGYYYVFDNTFNTTPDTTSRWTTNSTLNITTSDGLSQNGINGTNDTTLGVANGEWYLHIKAMDNAGNLGGETAHYMVTINITEATVTISNLSEIYSNSSSKVFEFVINNVGESTANFNWSLDFGDNAIVNSNSNTNLISGEGVSVFTFHNYANHGKYTLRASAQTGSELAASNIVTDAAFLNLTNLGIINASGTSRVFEFDGTNLMSLNLTQVGWNFNTGNSLMFNNTINTSLAQNEMFSAFIKYDYGTVGNFTINASISNNSIADYEVLNATVS